MEALATGQLAARLLREVQAIDPDYTRRSYEQAVTLDLLSVLRRSGPPYRPTTRELTERTLVTAGAISQRVARAEAAGLVQRSAGPENSRTVLVTLTSAGHDLVERLVDRVLGREEPT